MKTVLGGLVYLQNQANASANVEKIEFPKLIPTQSVRRGEYGTMYLKNPPSVVGHYSVKNILLYQDGNNHNNCRITIESNIGPTKYDIKIA